MDLSNFGLLLGMVEKACLVIIVFYLLSYTGLFQGVFSQKLNAGTKVIMAVIFGVLAIYGTYSGIQTSGAIANIRNLGPMMAGFVGGPWVGLGAGLIGGIHRFFIGGFTAFPCALGTIIAGLAAGILFMLLKGKIGIWKAALYAFVMEIVDMLLLLLIATPFNDALKLVNVIAMPMVLGDTIGIAIFAFMLHNMKKERKAG
jgi:sigma-B regulation protein RsbU (phosphoserine phosphatase)